MNEFDAYLFMYIKMAFKTGQEQWVMVSLQGLIARLDKKICDDASFSIIKDLSDKCNSQSKLTIKKDNKKCLLMFLVFLAGHLWGWTQWLPVLCEHIELG